MWNVSFVCAKSIHTAAKLNEVLLMFYFKALVLETLIVCGFLLCKAHVQGLFCVNNLISYFKCYIFQIFNI